MRHQRQQRQQGTNTQGMQLSIIIPARNEEHNLSVLLPLLRNQTLRPLEIIVVDDSSEDATAATADALGARVVRAEPLPDGWQGKSWACWSGARQAEGDYLVFLDADTIPQPSFIGQLSSLLYRKGGYVTIQPYHDAPTLREQWSALFNVVLLAGSGALSLFPGRSSSFGPCAACSRKDYDAVGGHMSIRSEVLEHLRLGERFRRCGLSVYGLVDKQVLQFRMYPHSFRELMTGWVKSIALGAGATSLWRLILIVIWITALIGGAITAAESIVIPASAAVSPLAAAAVYLLSAGSLGRGLRCAGSFGRLTQLLYPAYLLFFLVLFAYALFRSYIMRKVNWKGRSIDVS